LHSTLSKINYLLIKIQNLEEALLTYF
jgi:cytochrome P450